MTSLVSRSAISSDNFYSSLLSRKLVSSQHCRASSLELSICRPETSPAEVLSRRIRVRIVVKEHLESCSRGGIRIIVVGLCVLPLPGMIHC